MAEPGVPLPRSGSEFGTNLRRNQPGRDRGTGARHGADPWGGVAPAGGPGPDGPCTDRDHRIRYLLPSSEAFDLDLHATPPVLGAAPDEQWPR